MTFHATNPRTGEELPTPFAEATPEEIDSALNRASDAFAAYRLTSAAERAAFLEQIEEEVMALGEELLTVADSETALGLPRLTGERVRACTTIRLFAKLIREGSWVDARIETAIPDREPLPKPDVRLMHRPLGPVVVFGASNFPLAISVAGTDTVSALASGCPVVVKAHPAHPTTCELIAGAIHRAVEKCKMPEGVFSLVQGKTNSTGIALVKHEKTEVVAFTGSLRGGRALMDVAGRRPRPIPVYAEMGSINPVFVLPGALRERSEAIASGFVESLTLGAGQFCTNPAMVLGFGGEAFNGFLDSAVGKVHDVEPTTMLHEGIYAAYLDGVAKIRGLLGVEVVGEGPPASDAKNAATTALFKTEIETYFSHQDVLSEEVFGPTSVAVECRNVDDLIRYAETMPGSLSATIHGTEEDLETYRELVQVLETRTGRLIFNGFPTGLEVCSAIQHGGPYPASTHSLFTSVGTNAIYRFVRPVCFQGFPEAALPDELKSDNPLDIWRLVDGNWKR